VLFLRSLIFFIFYLAWTLLLGIGGLPLLLISEDAARWVPRSWSKGVLVALRLICHTKYEIRGREYLTSQPVLFACKHQSAWDIVMLLVLLKRPNFVLKRELIWLPLAGWYILRLRMISIDRRKGAAAMRQVLSKAREGLHEGKPLVIYPEGTRTNPGAEPHYMPGVATLYSQLMVPVVPVALNSGSFWGRNAFIKKPGTIVIEFLPPIAPGLPPRELMQELQTRIESASAKLLAEAK
jgi:1-acyl-sn-glycerol-3-phosphate acyltransferase